MSNLSEALSFSMSRIVGIDLLMFEFINVFSDDLFRFRGRQKKANAQLFQTGLRKVMQ